MIKQTLDSTTKVHAFAPLPETIAKYVNGKLKKTIGIEQRSAIFVAILNGATLKEQATMHNVSIVTIHNIVWRNIAILKYINGEIDYAQYHEKACCYSTVKICDSDLASIRDQCTMRISQYSEYCKPTICPDTKLINLKLRTRSLSALHKIGVETVADYLRKEDKIQKLRGIGVGALALIQPQIAHLRVANGEVA